MSFRIMMAGGGSGGHVYPLVAVAQELLKQEQPVHKHVGIAFIGDGDLMRREADALKIPFHRVMAPKWRRYRSIKNILDLVKIPLGMLQAFFAVLLYMPDVMLVKGGYASFLPALMARLMAIPLVVHESDSVPGRVNRFWGRHARRVFLAFDHAQKYFPHQDTEVIGNPIRDELLDLPTKEAGCAALQVSTEKPIVFVMGGSQGAQEINEVMELASSELSKKFSIIHQKDGSYDVEAMRNAYAAADVVVSRAGSAIFEIAVAGKPAILIPLDSAAQGHQLTNAEEFLGHGVVIIESDNLTPHILINEIESVYAKRDTMGAAMRAFAKPDAAAEVARELLDVA